MTTLFITILSSLLHLAVPTLAAFGLSHGRGLYTVDTGGGLAFQVDTANGNIRSLQYNGFECQDGGRFSQIGSGLRTATVSYNITGPYIIVTVNTDTLSHYYVAKNGTSAIYMATSVTGEPAIGELRWITRLSRSAFGNGISASDIRGGTAIEGADVFLVNGSTRSKFYSSKRFVEDQIHGVTGLAGAAYIVISGTGYEKSSGGPFFRDIDNNGAAQQELYFYMNSHHAQTEEYRTGTFGPYALIFTPGDTPDSSVDFSFMAALGIAGIVPASGRGSVTGSIGGIPNGFTSTVGFANGDAQYWAVPDGSSYTSPLMLPGSYTGTLYKNELAVATCSVLVYAGSTTTLDLVSAESIPTVIWRIGDADGTPAGFLNANLFERMHPSDTRMGNWGPVTFLVGESPVNSFPMAQFIDVNNPTTIQTSLTSSQIGSRTLRIRTTWAFAGGRPQVSVNGWTSLLPPAPTSLYSRGVTRGTWRGNNQLYEYLIPSGTLVTGSNTILIDIKSGSPGSGFLSPNVVYDSIELY